MPPRGRSSKQAYYRRPHRTIGVSPERIRGFSLKAKLERAGTLLGDVESFWQTCLAGRPKDGAIVWVLLVLVDFRLGVGSRRGATMHGAVWPAGPHSLHIDCMVGPADDSASTTVAAIGIDSRSVGPGQHVVSRLFRRLPADIEREIGDARLALCRAP